MLESRFGVQQSPSANLAEELWSVSEIQSQARRLIEEGLLIRSDWELEPYSNAVTGLFEELTSSGHITEIDLGEAENANQQTLQRLINANLLAVDKPKWLQDYYFFELCEELVIHETFQAVKESQLPEDTLVVTGSDYPKWIDDNEAWRHGFRPYSKTGMIRANYFFLDEDGSWRRAQEQISRSDSLKVGFEIAIAELTSTDVTESSISVSKQIITDRSTLPNGVVDVCRILDVYSGQHIKYGDDTRYFSRLHPEYEEIREVSRSRLKLINRYLGRLIELEKKANRLFDQGVISYEHKLAMIQDEKDRIVDRVCLVAPEFATEARGEDAASHYFSASIAIQSGNDQMAIYHIMEATAKRDPTASNGCGGSGSYDEAQRILRDAKESISDWTWRDGVCVIPECPTRPAKTKVGPCSICMRCQKLFDHKIDPSGATFKSPDEKYKGILNLLVKGSKKNKTKHE